MDSVKFDLSNSWTPDNTLEELNPTSEIGANDRSFQITECFKVWGRGRPRPPISQIVLPRTSVTVSNIQLCDKLPKSRGRGHLLLLDIPDIELTSSNVLHVSKQFNKPKQEHENNFKKDIYDLQKDFPSLKH